MLAGRHVAFTSRTFVYVYDFGEKVGFAVLATEILLLQISLMSTDIHCTAHYIFVGGSGMSEDREAEKGPDERHENLGVETGD